jgi:hypothetical protein
MSSNFATITGTPGLVIRLSTEETFHATSVRKPKNIGDTYLAARTLMLITTDPPLAKKSKRTCNVASPCRLMDSYRKRNPTPLIRHTVINQPAFAIPNFS